MRAIAGGTCVTECSVMGDSDRRQSWWTVMGSVMRGDSILKSSICAISYKNHTLFSFDIQYNIVKQRYRGTLRTMIGLT